ncbi:MAG: TolC family protein [Flavobacteriales bacterium]|nr:TolC family protein [Flavobacteriales bacterium]MCB9363210.1 TolC family protein [Flavobacteriales bacterium]
MRKEIKNTMRTLFVIIGLNLLNVANAQETKVWTLQECVNYALENNISIKQSELDKNIAIQDVKAAKWKFAPNLNANASHNYNFGSSITASGARASADFQSNNFGLNSSVNLFNGFANIHTLKQSKIGVEAQEAALAKMRNDISLNVVNGYLQVLFAKEQVKVAQSQVAISEAQVARIEELVNAGSLAEGDLFNVKSNLATDQQSLVVAQNTQMMASLRLAQLLQLKEANIDVQDVSVEVTDQVILSNDVMEIYDKANATFPEIKQAELNIESAKQSVKISRASFYPSLSLNMGMSTVYQHRQGMTDFITFSDQLDQNLGKSIGVSLNVPIFNRYQFRTNVNKSKINYLRTEYLLEGERLRLRETIQTAYTNAKAASKSYEASKTSVEAQTKAFNYADERYKAGAINSFDFNQTKNNLLNAQSQLIRSKYDFVFKLKVLEFYSGVPIVIE